METLIDLVTRVSLCEGTIWTDRSTAIDLFILTVFLLTYFVCLRMTSWSTHGRIRLASQVSLCTSIVFDQLHLNTIKIHIEADPP